ncbi:hypothetical protein BURPSS13_C0006 [Burkholderia pseudomallei S13]|nr:hypothetical protein BURPSS13_C0006 [Burkholderia pseudomallei S13]
MITASRPNGVENHGMPAYGYGPVSSDVVSRPRSASERSSHALKSGLLVCTRAIVRRRSRIARCTSASALRSAPRPVATHGRRANASPPACAAPTRASTVRYSDTHACAAIVSV